MSDAHLNPLSRHDHFSHTRGPRTEAEVMEVDGWMFTPIREVEAVLWLRTNAPDLVDQVAAGFREPATLAAYQRRRAAAIAIGRGVGDPAFSMLAVETVRAARPGAGAALYAAWQAAATVKVKKGLLPTDEWGALLSARKALRPAISQVGAARAALALRPDGAGASAWELTPLGSFTDELNAIVEALYA